jgi:hypothetical protein
MLRRCPPGAQLPCMGDCRVWTWTFRTGDLSEKEDSSIDWVMDLWCNMVKFLGSEFEMTIVPGPQQLPNLLVMKSTEIIRQDIEESLNYILLNINWVTFEPKVVNGVDVLVHTENVENLFFWPFDNSIRGPIEYVKDETGYVRGINAGAGISQYPVIGRYDRYHNVRFGISEIKDSLDADKDISQDGEYAWDGKMRAYGANWCIFKNDSPTIPKYCIMNFLVISSSQEELFQTLKIMTNRVSQKMNSDYLNFNDQV